MKKKYKILLCFKLFILVALSSSALYGNTNAYSNNIMQTPFLGVNSSIPGTLECEHYDIGGQNISFFDKNGELDNTSFRPGDEIDVITKANASNGLCISKTRKDEWMEYSVDVVAGQYDIALTYFTDKTNTGELELLLDGNSVATISGMLPQENWNTQGSITVSNISLPGGDNQTLRLLFPDVPRFQIDALEFILLDENCPNGLIVGDSCNDNDDCTINDTITADCNCEGIVQDSDGDGICDANETDLLTDFTLVNADTEEDISTISNEDIFVLPSHNLNIKANLSSGVGSVVFNLTSTDGVHTQTESVAPYALFGDNNGDFSPWLPVPSAISYTLTATAFSQGNGNGTALDTKVVTFSFTNEDIVNEIPQPASGLTGAASDHDVINLSWNDNSDNESAFRIQYINDNGDFVFLAQVAANITSFTDTQSSIGADRAYRVRSLNSVGTANASNIVAVTNKPDVISGFSALNLGGNDYELSWNAPDFGTRYTIESSTSQNSGFTVLDDFVNEEGDHSYDLENIGTSTMFYRIRVYSEDNSEFSAWSNVLSIANNPNNSQAEITGEMRQWHKITLTFDGPMSSETSTPNPFSDYKFDVTFTNGSSTYVVPGYFGADGNAAESSATSGNKWIAHFSPDKTGTWSYTTTFYEGTDVAVGGNIDSEGILHGLSGSFNVSASNKTGRDLRGKGRLAYVNEHYLQFQGDGSWFFKAGSDAPENTLAYEDFDDVPNRGNRRKSWNPHQVDYVASDASDYTWKNGKGTELLGVINYLSSIGVNAYSFLTFSLAGDDENVFPHLLKVDVSAYNGLGDNGQWNNGVHHDRFDVSRLAQWENIFSYADKKGMYSHFKTQETENNNRMDNGNVERERKLYYRELIARFSHHLALNWNTGEENVQSIQNEIAMAQYLHDTDPYKHNIVMHTFPGQYFRYDSQHGDQSEYTGASIQTSNATFNEVYSVVNTQYEKSQAAGKKWVVALDEPGNAQIGIDSDPDDIDLVRKKVLWNTMFAGGAGVEYYYGYQSGPCTDLSCQDHRTRAIKYGQAKHAINFFENHLQPFLPIMIPNNSLVSNNSALALTNGTNAVLVYLPDGGSTNVTLNNNNNWILNWYNPRTGVMRNDNITVNNTITAPNANDWLALITTNGSQVRDNSINANATSLTNDFRIHPNPASDIVTIDLDNQMGNYSIRITSATGKVVKEQTIQQGKTQINIRNIAPGMYNIVLFNGSTAQSKRLIVVK